MFTDGLLVGSLYTAALSGATMLGFLVAGGFTWQTLRDGGPQMTVAMLFSLLLGVWVSRIVDQSVDRAELIHELQAARTELTEAEHARGVMAERERMAREIHDTLAQGFTSVIMLSQAAAAGMAKDPGKASQRLAQIEEVARENLAEARALVAAFGPVGLADSTLPDAVQRLTERFGAQTGSGVDVEIAEAATALSLPVTCSWTPSGRRSVGRRYWHRRWRHGWCPGCGRPWWRR
jgi:signal transduction histidine kinase